MKKLTNLVIGAINSLNGEIIAMMVFTATVIYIMWRLSAYANHIEQYGL